MKIKTNDLKDKALDWAVHQAWCEGACHDEPSPCYSTDWAQGGPIIEREGICVFEESDRTWTADSYRYTDLDSPLYSGQGRTPLVAAMRCYVESRLGDEVEIPEELT
jgi:hypothetical protein